MTEPRRARPPSRTRELLAAAALFLLATALATWPLAFRVNAALPDLWDNKLTAWILHWDYHQVFRDPLRLFDANIHHPARWSLAFSENLLGAAVFGFPLYAAGASTLAVQNVLLLLGMFLSALAAWALARDVTGDPAASLVAGLVYAFVPWRIEQIPHLQFQWGPFLPLLVLFLRRYLAGGSRRDLALFAGCLAWNALCNVHLAVFSVFLVAALLLVEAFAGGASRGRRIAAAVAAAAAAALVVLPVFVPYARASRLYGLERSAHEVEWYSGRITEFLSAGARNRLYGRLTARFSHPEGDFFPGAAALVLAALALRRRPREDSAPRPGAAPRIRRPAAAAVLDAVAALLLVLALAAALLGGFRIGPLHVGDPGRPFVLACAAAAARLAVAFPRRSRYGDLRDFVRRGPLAPDAARFAAVGAVGVLVALGVHTPFYRFLYESGGFVLRAIRAPARGIVLVHLALAVLAALGLAAWTRRIAPRRRAFAIAGALAAVAFEYRAAPIPVFPVDPAPPPVYGWLAGGTLPGAVLEWPLGNAYDFDYEFRSTAHWRPLVNGSTGFAPPLYRELSAALDARESEEVVWEKVLAAEAAVLVFHPHGATRDVLEWQLGLVRRAAADGRLVPAAAFPHGAATDVVFRIAAAGGGAGGIAPESRREAAARLAALVLHPADAMSPAGFLESPSENLEVASGAYGYGWAADDSGIREIAIATELGPAGRTATGGPRPDVARVIGNVRDAARSGFAFPIPPLPPGPHVLTVTIVANDGGVLRIRRAIRIRRPGPL